MTEMIGVMEKSSRQEADVLRDLQQLCIRPGFAHVIAYFCWRYNFIRAQSKEFKAKDFLGVRSTDRLIRTEISLLIGFYIQGEVDLITPTYSVFLDLASRAESLLAELHDFLKMGFVEVIKEAHIAGTDISQFNPFKDGRTLREPIFYAGESGYISQYSDFSNEKYKYDIDWMRTNKGFTPDQLIQFQKAVSNLQVDKVNAFKLRNKDGNTDIDFLPIFVFTKPEVLQRSNLDESVIDSIINSFSLGSLPCNNGFFEIGSFNLINAAPFIPIGNQAFILFQNYNLVEAFYESPFFWMKDDASYREQAFTNRGKFAEDFIERRFRSIFQTKHVFKNVKLYRGKDEVGEIDVLLIYADRAVIVQAKSKKLTAEARKGKDQHLRHDFKLGIQDAYDQGWVCAQHILQDDIRLVCKGNPINANRSFKEIYVLCVLSENYPGLSFQAEHFLEHHQHEIIRPPYVIDVFFLDVLCEFLTKPLYFFSYLDRRTSYFGTVHTACEIAVLSYHLRKNLWLGNKTDFMMIADDCSVDIDVAMAVRRDGIPGKATPAGILTKFENTIFANIIDQINRVEEGRLLDLGYFLLMLDENTVSTIVQSCKMIIARTNADGKIHDFTIGAGDSGLTIHCSNLDPVSARERLQAHCIMKKYSQKTETWFGISINPNSHLIDFCVGLNHPWEQSDDIEKAIAQTPITKPYKSLKQALADNNYCYKAHRRTGRNDLCPCGTGKKYKQCCLKI